MSVEIDHNDLASFNIRLAEALSENPDRVLPIMETVLSETGFIDGEPEPRISNVADFDAKPIAALNEDDMNRLVVVTGVLQSVSEPKMRMTDAVFECNNCHETYKSSKRNKDGSVKAPNSCKCGNTDSFERIQVGWTPVRIMSVKERPGRGKRHQLKVEVFGRLAKERRSSFKATGSAVKVIGFLEAYKEKKRQKHYQLKVKANNVVIEDEKWDDHSLTKGRVDEIKELPEKHGDQLPDVLARSLVKDRIAHMDLLKKAVLVWMLGRSSDDGNIHVLCVGEPGLAKSDLLTAVKERFGKILKASGTSSTGVGLTASVTEDKIIGGYVAEAGSLAMADGGFHVLDEAGKVDGDDLKKLNEALSDEVITLDKASIHTEIPADVGCFAICNPEDSLFDSHKEVYRQIPIGYDELLDRFDVKIGLKRRDIEDDADRVKEEDVIDAVLNRGGNGASVVNGDVVDEDVLVDFVRFAQDVDPVFTDAAKDKIKEVYFGLRGAEHGNGETGLWDVRRSVSLKKVSRAFARMFLSDTVEERHVRCAAQFMRETLESIDFEVGSDSLKDIGSNDDGDKGGRRSVLDVLRGKDTAFVEDIADELDMSDDAVEERLQNLSKQGRVGEPKPGMWKVI